MKYGKLLLSYSSEKKNGLSMFATGDEGNI
jgi:hypothetical protein